MIEPPFLWQCYEITPTRLLKNLLLLLMWGPNYQSSMIPDTEPKDILLAY